MHSLPSQSVRTHCVILDTSTAMTSVITLETRVQSVSTLCSALRVGSCLLPALQLHGGAALKAGCRLAWQCYWSVLKAESDQCR